MRYIVQLARETRLPGIPQGLFFSSSMFIARLAHRLLLGSQMTGRARARYRRRVGGAIADVLAARAGIRVVLGVTSMVAGVIDMTWGFFHRLAAGGTSGWYKYLGRRDVCPG